MTEIYRSYIRAAVEVKKDSREISGTPIVFGKRSVLMYDWNHGKCYEVIERGAISKELLKNDIIACINHDPGQVLARCVDGAGSLHLELGEDGVGMSFDAPKTAYGDIAYEGCKRGDFQGMSFGFTCDPDIDMSYTRETDDDGNEIYIRHVNHIKQLFDVSIVTYPAYPDTDVEARSRTEAEFRSAFGDGTLKGPAQNDPKPEERSKEMMRDFDEISKFLNH